MASADLKAEEKAVAAYPAEQVYETVESLLAIRNKMRSGRLEHWSEKLVGTSKIELHILLLAQARPDIVLGEIRDRLDVPHSTLTGVIDRMERQGLARRTISARDRRSYGLEILEKGRDVRKEHDRMLAMLANKMLAALDERERETFIGLLSKVARNIE